MPKAPANGNSVEDFFSGKSEHTKELFYHLMEKFRSVGNVEAIATKSMIGIAASAKKIAWVTQAGKNFIHVVFPFEKPYPDNLCFVKIAQVPGDDKQYNHHFRMYFNEDINEEVLGFIKLAFRSGS
jgi:hypothetical protein